MLWCPWPPPESRVACDVGSEVRGYSEFCTKLLCERESEDSTLESVLRLWTFIFSSTESSRKELPECLRDLLPASLVLQLLLQLLLLRSILSLDIERFDGENDEE